MQSHLILGGQRSGKSRFAERLGVRWLAQSATHRVSVVATALAGDDEMRDRIARHRQDRPAGFEVLEAPYQLGSCIQAWSQPDRLLVVDCLPLWLTNWLMPLEADASLAQDWPVARADLLRSLERARGPVVLVTNEIGWGVIPSGSGVRHFVDELGRLNQDVAQRCKLVTLMAAGQPWTQEVQVW